MNTMKHYSILNPAPFARQDDQGRPIACVYTEYERAAEGYITLPEIQDLADQGLIEIHEILTPDLASDYGRTFVVYTVL